MYESPNETSTRCPLPGWSASGSGSCCGVTPISAMMPSTANTSARVPDTIANTSPARTTKARITPGGAVLHADADGRRQRDDRADEDDGQHRARARAPLLVEVVDGAFGEQRQGDGGGDQTDGKSEQRQGASHPGGLPTAAKITKAARVRPAQAAAARNPIVHWVEGSSSVRARVISPPAAR